MTVTAVYDMNKKKVGEMELSDDVFGREVNEGLIHRAVCAHLANCRQGNASVKTRAEVRGGGKKPYRQKGTGRARHGSIRSPIFVGGGVAWGPHPRDYHVDMPKKEVLAAMKMGLSQKTKEGGLFVVSDFASKDGKTSGIAKTLKKWETESCVIVIHAADKKTAQAVRNIPNVKLVTDRNLSLFDVVKYEHLLMTKDAVGNVTTRLTKN
jgi:large subunit ribosomal protein L4